jgi:hypothetical protein
MTIYIKKTFFIYFLFSDEQHFKFRLVLINYNDIYTQKLIFHRDCYYIKYKHPFDTIKITNDNMETGNLKQESLVKVDKITSIEQSDVEITIENKKKDILKILKTNSCP